MALGAITVVSKFQAPGPINIDEITLAGDGAYVAGGTAGFQALVRTALAKGAVTILHVITKDAGGQTVTYTASTDKLKVFDGTSEHANANLSAITMRLIVVSK